MKYGYQFNRLELAGSLGDLGTLLPIAMGMILINGLDPLGLFFSIGVFYILTGVYFGITVPVQPMKVIGAYSIAASLSAAEIQASGILIALFLLVIGVTGAITLIGKYIPKEVVRGIQMSTGVLLMVQGVRLMMGTSQFQLLQKAAEPYLTIQTLGPIPIGIIIGVCGGLATLLLLENKKLPAGLCVILGGLAIGLLIGAHEGFDKMKIGIYLPTFLPFGLPTNADFTFALLALVIPQTPMTLGNAVIAYSDLSAEYYGSASRKVTYRSACISMALGNIISFLFGGMPLCHGAGGLAAHYRFGARSTGSNIIIGVIFLVMALLLGTSVIAIAYLIPMAILGILLIFAGSQLALTILDIWNRKQLFVAFMMMGITLASNLAVAFMVGVLLAYILKSEAMKI
ncbi:putative sulfate/molybdate transporter [Desulfococcaceae bacterium HSG9]|nr:putative sulfate/molybdate transporter [Desulfococcaceae bacterium HSG9]